MLHTRALRVLLMLFLVGLVLTIALPYVVSLDLAADYPEFGEARLPPTSPSCSVWCHW